MKKQRLASSVGGALFRIVFMLMLTFLSMVFAAGIDGLFLTARYDLTGGSSEVELTPSPPSPSLPCYGAYSDVSGMAVYVVVDGAESGGLFLIRLAGMGSNVVIENLGFGMRVCSSVELSDEWCSELAERGVNVNTQAIDVFRPFGE